MAEEKEVNIEQTFFSESYQMRSDHKGKSGSTLTARQPAGSYGATSASSYGFTTGGEDTTITFSSAAPEDGTGETDKARLLSEKIRKKKQGMERSYTLCLFQQLEENFCCVVI